MRRSWVVLAASVGIVIGLGVGRLLEPRTQSQSAAWLASGSTPRPLGPEEADAQMLAEIDAALARSRSVEFRALDQLTPRIADARARGGR